MALQGKLPSKIQKRLKLLVYGPAGCGKTFCALGFPKSYYIDTEGSAKHDQYIDLMEKNETVYYSTQDFFTLENEVKELANCKHDFKTLIIDPITIIYQSLVDSFEDKGYNEHYKKANRIFRRFINLLNRLDMNIVLISHSKDQYYIDPKSKEMSVVGQTYDTYKKSDYMLDLLLETKSIDGRRMATVKKSRISGFPLHDEFEFSYEQICKRYDKNILEKDSTPIMLATDKTLKVLENIFESNGYSQEQIDKWLKRRNLEKISELTEKEATDFIERMKTKEEKENV